MLFRSTVNQEEKPLTMTLMLCKGSKLVRQYTELINGEFNSLSDEFCFNALGKCDQSLRNFKINYSYTPQSNQISIEIIKSQFGVYLLLDTETIIIDESVKSFILGDTIFAISTQLKDSGVAYDLTYMNVKEKIVTRDILMPGFSYCIGRAPELMDKLYGITITHDEFISRCHAILNFNDELKTWLMKNNSSLNGIFVENSKLKFKLAWDQLIRIGMNTYLYFSTDW